MFTDPEEITVVGVGMKLKILSVSKNCGHIYAKYILGKFIFTCMPTVHFELCFENNKKWLVRKSTVNKIVAYTVRFQITDTICQQGFLIGKTNL